MKIACISDLHGHLPDLSAHDFDILLIGGDICPTSSHKVAFQRQWLDTIFRKWLDAISVPVVSIAGNHDFIFQNAPDTVPKLDWTYLEDSGAEVLGLKIWGSPWQKWFGGWAFNAKEQDMKKKWDMIPDDTDIFLLHGPAYGLGDCVMSDNEHVGSPSLRERIGVVQPKLVVYGHIHEGHGQYELGSTIVVNASYLNERYEPKNGLTIVDISLHNTCSSIADQPLSPENSSSCPMPTV